MVNIENTEKEEARTGIPQENKLVRRKTFLAGGAVLIVLAGLISGYFLSNKEAGKGIFESGSKAAALKEGMEFGSKDTKAFKDTAEGVVEKGGIKGEGSHKLIREGGPSQTVYLTSSIVNLDDFAGRKVKVWGETFAGQKAGWLMDVGRVKILE